jgi:nitrite reductase/ring-hydroxylating ferredoxin subunit
MATVVEGGRVGQIVESSIDRQQEWLDPLAEELQGRLTSLLEQGGPSARRVKNFLNGTWLGHPLHPVLTDAALGAWFTGALLDLFGSRRGADTAHAIGVVAALPTAAAGLADWHDLGGKQRRTGMAHALVNGGALVCFIGSLMARGSGRRALGIGLSTAGLTLASGAAYLGGELVFAHGTQVDRNAWNPETEGWQVAARADELSPGQLSRGEIEVDGQKLPLVLLKQGQRVLAIGAVCAHQGGPLQEGRLEGEQCVVCPWHGSTFDLEDGSIVHGPAAYPQPCYETRQRDGNVEVRLKA